MPEYLLLTLEAPLISFGGPSLDHRRPTEDFPGTALLAGLLGNALGWRRGQDAERLQALQEALAYAVRIDREPAGRQPLTDLQTVALNPPEQGWTTYGQPQGRERTASAGGGLDLRHLRYRDYHCDLKATAALTLQPPPPPPRGDSRRRPPPPLPGIPELAAALAKPARPLFLGRKACLPSGPLCRGVQAAATALDALLRQPLEQEQPPPSVRIQYPDTPEERAAAAAAGAETRRGHRPADRREWRAGRHAGRSAVEQARLPRTSFPPLPPTSA